MTISEVLLEICSQMLFLIGHFFSCLLGVCLHAFSSVMCSFQRIFKHLVSTCFFRLKWQGFLSWQEANMSARCSDLLNQSGSMVSSSSSPGWCPDVEYEDIDAMLKDLEDPV